MNLYNSLVSGFQRASQTLATWIAAVGNHVGPLAIAALVLGATVVVAWAVTTLVLRPRDDLAELLEPYRLHRTPVTAKPESLEAKLPLLRRAAEVLSGLAERRGLRPVLEEKLMRAGLPIGAGEFLLMVVAGALLLVLIGLLAVGVPGLVGAVLVAALAPAGVLQLLVERRSRRFGAQLPDVLKLLAGSLRAGFSLMQGLDAVVEQISDPIQQELRRALAAARLGVPIEDALTEAADRVGSRDFAWTVTAVRIQREVGGNLAEILDTVWDTMLQRQRLQREVKTLTAEGRISAIIVSALPVALGGFIYMANRPYISQLFDNLSGQMALLGAVALEIVGIWWMHRTIQIEV